VGSSINADVEAPRRPRPPKHPWRRPRKACTRIDEVGTWCLEQVDLGTCSSLVTFAIDWPGVEVDWMGFLGALREESRHRNSIADDSTWLMVRYPTLR
jgi:hypothetical protein